MAENFVAIDVETANADYASICQIGVVLVRNSEIAAARSYLINPNDYFDPFNTGLHGINAEMVANAPLFRDTFSRVAELIEPFPILHHGPFDKVSVSRAAKANDIEIPNLKWLDTTKIVRRTWKEFSKSGYGLKNLTNHFDIELEHHDAVSDARATAKIALLAAAESKTALDEWIAQIERPAQSSSGSPKMEGKPTGEYFGETIVFTGTMRCPRNEAAQQAQSAGFNVANSVSQKTTILCVGDIQDRDRFAGYNKSSKHRKAEELVNSGRAVRIISEQDFFNLIE